MTNYSETVSGDISNNRLATTGLALTLGSNTVTSSQSSADDDFFTITIPAGHKLSQIILVSYSAADLAFLAIQAGGTFTENPAAPNVGNILGAVHYGPTLVGTNILDNMGVFPGTIGFTPPLTGSTYTFWFNQTSAATTTVSVNFIVEAIATNGADSIDGGAAADTISALDGNDTVRGAGGADSLSGDNGADQLFGDAGNDTMRGGAGVDTLRGGDDNDSLFGDAQADTVFGDSGDDTIDSGTGNDVVDGGGQKDRIFTGSGFDSLIGGGGNDTLQGGNDNDTMLGGAAFDVLEGGDGNDSLAGGDSNDVIFGGVGNDTIVFNLGDDTDTIRDFTAGAGVGDVIRLVGFGAAFNTFAEILAAATDNGVHTTINFGGGDVLVLRGVLVSQLAADDFTFG